MKFLITSIVKLFILFLLTGCSDNYYDLLRHENLPIQPPPFIISEEILLSDFETNSGRDEEDMTLLFRTNSGEILSEIVPEQRGMFYSEKSGSPESSEIIPLVGLANKIDTGEYGTTIKDIDGKRFSFIESHLRKNCAENEWCQTMFGFSFFINNPGTIGENINEHRTVDLRKTSGISFRIKGSLDQASLFLVMVSANIRDWSHWQIKINEHVTEAWKPIEITWPEFSDAGWGDGINITAVNENLICVEGFKFVFKNEITNDKVTSTLSIDDIKITIH